MDRQCLSCCYRLECGSIIGNMEDCIENDYANYEFDEDAEQVEDEE